VPSHEQVVATSDRRVEPLIGFISLTSLHDDARRGALRGDVGKVCRPTPMQRTDLT
jgi:hypothetical protein